MKPKHNMLKFIQKVDMAQICHSTAILKDILECFDKHMRNNRCLNGTLMGGIPFVELTFIY